MTFLFLDPSYYYGNGEGPIISTVAHVTGSLNNNFINNGEQSGRSPMAATRANSLASANSPTESGSACLKTEVLFSDDLHLG